MIYVFIFFFLFLASFSDKKYHKVLYIALIAFLIFFGGFRADTIGVDTAGGYKTYWNLYLNGNPLSFVEPAWFFLMSLCVRFNLGYSGLIFISELLCILPTSYVIYKQKNNNIIFSLAIYYGMFFFLHSFNLIRQSIAMSFCLLFAYFFYEKKYYKAIFSFVLAFLMHKSALIFIIAIFFNKFVLTRTRIIFLCFITFCAGLLLSKRFFIILAGPYAGYLENSSFGFRNMSMSLILLDILMNVFLISYILLGKRKNLSSFYLKTLVLGMLCMNMTMTLELGTRLILYFTQAQIIFYPEYFKIKRNDKNILFCVLVLYFFVNFIKILIGQWDSLTPYRLFFL